MKESYPGANSDLSGVMPPDEKNPVFALLMPRLAEEYRRLSPTPDKFETFSAEIGQMWATQPRWSEADLARIRNPVAIADGDHEDDFPYPYGANDAANSGRAIDFVAGRFALRPISRSSAVQRSRAQFPRSAVTAPAQTTRVVRLCIQDARHRKSGQKANLPSRLRRGDPSFSILR